MGRSKTGALVVVLTMTLEEYKEFLPRCYDEDDVDFLMELAAKELNSLDYFALLLAAQDRRKEMRKEVNG